jgi:hypothetical protein
MTFEAALHATNTNKTCLRLAFAPDFYVKYLSVKGPASASRDARAHVHCLGTQLEIHSAASS